MDLVNIEDRVIMSIRAQQTDSELPCFSALFSKAPLQEQHQHMIFMVTQLKVSATFLYLFNSHDFRPN